MSGVSYQIAHLLEKVRSLKFNTKRNSQKGNYVVLGNVIKLGCCLFQMTSSDKDFRFMATNDLMTELQKDSIKVRQLIILGKSI